MGASGAGHRQRNWAKVPRPPKQRAPLTEEQKQLIRDMYEVGFKTKTIARQLSLALTTIERYLRHAAQEESPCGHDVWSDEEGEGGDAEAPDAAGDDRGPNG